MMRAFPFMGSRPLSGGDTPDGVWSALSVMSVVNPMDYGAAGDGVTNDLTALQNAVAALPSSGGIVYLPVGKSFRKQSALWTITKPHLKFWAPNGQAELYSTVGGTGDGVQAFKSAQAGFGFFGVKLRSDATARNGSATEDDHMVTSTGSLVEFVGCEIDGSRAAGLFMFGSDEHYVCGNYVHHTWADHIHHTDGARDSWCWENWVYNPIVGGGVQRGDDGIACVTYGPGSQLCGNYEWWRNALLETDWGRGFTVIGGEDIHIHHNWAIEVAGAGILVATEPAFDSAEVYDVLAHDNWITRCGHTIGHTGILVSGQNPGVDLDSVDFVDNVSADNTHGGYSTNGSFTNVTNTGLSTDPGDLPTEPVLADVVLKDTSILATRDVSHVTAGSRPGLYRIHVRETSPGSGSYQERFEYVVKGTPSDVSSWVAARTGAGDYLSEQQTVSGTAYALLLCAAPVTLGTGVAAVTHSELRTGDNNGTLSWLWNRINGLSYA